MYGLSREISIVLDLFNDIPVKFQEIIRFSNSSFVITGGNRITDAKIETIHSVARFLGG